MRRRLAPPLVLVAMLALPGAAQSNPTAVERAAKPARVQDGKRTARPARVQRADARRLLRRIDHFQRVTWRWQALMRVKRTPSAGSARRERSLAYRRWVLSLWQRRALRTQRRAARPPHRSAWLCIQSHEGAWSDPNAPYYGGLQMDLSFQRAYGSDLLRRRGTADRWTPLEQMWVGERALRAGRGFYPWPNAARMCGLI